MRAVAAHERDKKTTEMQVADRIDHAGKRRQKAGKHQPPSLDHHMAFAVRWVANTSGRFCHGCLEKRVLCRTVEDFVIETRRQCVHGVNMIKIADSGWGGRAEGDTDSPLEESGFEPLVP